jgi:hypothetical protein
VGSSVRIPLGKWPDGWTVAFLFVFAFSDRTCVIAHPVPPFMELLFIYSSGDRKAAGVSSLVRLVHLEFKKQRSKFLVRNVELTTSASPGLINKQYFLLPLTKSTDCFISGREDCCYRTFCVMNQYMAVAQGCRQRSARWCTAAPWNFEI